MHPQHIQAWIDLLSPPPSSPKSSKPRQVLSGLNSPILNARHTRSAISSPPKRQRVEVPDDHVFQDPDTTPRRPQRASRRANEEDTVSSFGAALAIIPTLHSSQSTSSSSPSLKRRNSSTSMRFQNKASLRSLNRRVKFTQEADLGLVLPADAQALYEALTAVENREGILPKALQGAAELKGTKIRPHMWQSGDVSVEECQAAIDGHRRVLEIVHDSIESSNMLRSEAAWNAGIHFPTLRHCLSPYPSVKFELITMAQIVSEFRPLFDGRVTHDALSSSASTSSISGKGSRRATNQSAHKMVDFAVNLQPDEELKALIEKILYTQPYGCDTINQTMYEPLRLRPAPIFIETKNKTGSIEAATTQLAVWVSAWHERLRSIMALSGIADRIITAPAIQVVGAVWSVLFVVDQATEIHILDKDFRIGDTNSVEGLYQLQAALRILADWMEKDFKPWITSLLTRVRTSIDDGT